MPRQPRLDIPGALHHIMVRGINKTDIFMDDQDRVNFLQRLGENITETKSSVYAWVLMSNHVHILFKSGKKGISTVMRKLLTWYAIYFNRRHNRSGHLFENRYKSILCEEDRYLLALIRYIHLNPIRSGIVKDIEALNSYPWSGHSAVMGKSKCKWMDTEYVLAQFGTREKAATKAYSRFMEKGLNIKYGSEFTGGGLVRSLGGWSQVLSMRRRDQEEEFDERILGEGDFVQNILREAEEKDIRQLKLRLSGKTITDIIKEECKKRQVSIKELQGGSRRNKVSQTRALIAYRSIEELGLSTAEIARHLGVATSTATRAIARGEELYNA
ncbi:MAG: transposase [Nitrospirota bacterium]|nr:transposase [Nitrospirota bacterium]